MALQDGQKVRYRPTGEVGRAYLANATVLHGGASTMFQSSGSENSNALYYFCTLRHDDLDHDNPPADCTLQSESMLDAVEG